MPAPSERPSFVAHALTIAAKDLRIEWRSREILATMGFLALLIVLVFAFAFVGGEDSRLEPPITSGIFWVSILFSGVVALARTFDREREGEAIRALLLSPAPRAAIFVGKLAGTTALMLIVQLAVAPLVALFFGADLGRHPLWLAALLAIGSLGFAAAGTVFSAALLRAKSRDVLLSALLFPVLIPLLLAGAKATSHLLDPTVPSMAGALLWTRFLLALDVLYVVLGLWAFEPIVTGD